MYKSLLKWLQSWFKKPIVLPAPVPRRKPRRKNIKRLPKCPVLFKTSYKEESVAKREAKKRKLRAYHCEFCPYWHLTHKKRHRW